MVSYEKKSATFLAYILLLKANEICDDNDNDDDDDDDNDDD